MKVERMKEGRVKNDCGKSADKDLITMDRWKNAYGKAVKEGLITEEDKVVKMIFVEADAEELTEENLILLSKIKELEKTRYELLERVDAEKKRADIAKVLLEGLTKERDDLAKEAKNRDRVINELVKRNVDLQEQNERLENKLEIIFWKAVAE